MAEYTRILLRQGPDREKNNVIFKSGEPVFITDYERILIGNGVTPGGITVGSKFLGFTSFDPVSLEVFDVKPGYSGDFMFETTTNLLYVLSGTDTILGKQPYQIKTNYLPINKTPYPDEITLTNNDGALSLALDGIDARYIAPFALGNGLQRNIVNPTILEMSPPAPELQFVEGILQITDGGVENIKFANMRANTVKARLNVSGPPEDISFDDLKRSLGLITEGGALALGVPVGTIIDFAGARPPSNFFLCDGRELPVNDYFELYTAIGTTWGNPTLSTFNIPNLNRRTTIGSGNSTALGSSPDISNSVGSYGGLESQRLSNRQLPPHIHKVAFTIPSHRHTFTLDLPQTGGIYDAKDIITNGYNNYITIINGNGPDSAPQSSPAGFDSNTIIRSQASALIKGNKRYIQQRVVDYVNTNFPYALTAFYTDSVGNTGLPLSAVCFRDAGYIVDSYAADILNNANHRSVETGNLYFSGFITTQKKNYPGSNVPSLPYDQVFPTILSIEAIGSFIAGVNMPVSIYNYSNVGILSSLDFYSPVQKTIVSGLRNFTSVIANSGNVPVTTPSNSQFLDNTYYTAASSIAFNKQLLQQRVVEYVNYNFPYALSGNNELNSEALSAKCYRDSGYIIDSLVADILNDANHRSVETGLFYFSGALLARANNFGTTVPMLPYDQVFATIQAISSIGKFITGLSMPVERNNTTYGILSTNPYFTNSQQILLSSLNNFTLVISNSAAVPRTTPGGLTNVAYFSAASNAILAQRANLQQQVVEYVKYNFVDALSGVDNNASNALSAKCYRDTGYIVDSIAADILNNANHRSVETGVFYFSGAVLAAQNNLNTSVPTLPANQVNATIAAISALGVYITGDGIPALPTPFTPVGVLSSAQLLAAKPLVKTLSETVYYPLQNNGQILSYSPAGSATIEDINLGNAILQNKTTIQNAVSSYVLRKNYLTFNPSTSAEITAKCNRDVGFMVDAIANDLKTGVNAKSIQYAVAYWDGSTSRIPEINIPNQKNNTLDTINHLRSVALEVAINNSNTVSNRAIKKVNTLIDAMVYPLQAGGASRAYQPSGITSVNAQQAASVLLANKSSIQDRVTNYVVFKSYLIANTDLLAKCRRDVGFMVDAIANDLNTGVNAKSVQYALAYWDGSASRLREIQGSTLERQRANTIDTIEYLQSIILDYLTLDQSNLINEIIDLAKTMSYPLKNNGQLPDYRPRGEPLTDSRQAAANLLLANRADLQSKTRRYVDSLNIIRGTTPDRIILQEKCNRDVGYMIDSIVNDLVTGVNARSIQFGLSYWDGTKNRLSGNSIGSPNQVAATISTIRYLRDQCIGLIQSNGVATPSNATITTTTSPSGNFVYDGFTGSGNDQLFNDPVSNMQPSAVVNKCIKYR